MSDVMVRWTEDILVGPGFYMMSVKTDSLCVEDGATDYDNHYGCVSAGESVYYVRYFEFDAIGFTIGPKANVKIPDWVLIALDVDEEDVTL